MGKNKYLAYPNVFCRKYDLEHDQNFFFPGSVVQGGTFSENRKISISLAYVRRESNRFYKEMLFFDSSDKNWS